MLYILSSTHSPVWSGSSKMLSKLSFRSHKFINGGIRTFKTRIWNGEETRIHLDPKHCFMSTCFCSFCPFMKTEKNTFGQPICENTENKLYS